MKHPISVLVAALAVTLASAGPAAAYIDPGTGSMLLQMIGAGIAGAIFYFRELRMKRLRPRTAPNRRPAAQPIDARARELPLVPRSRCDSRRA